MKSIVITRSLSNHKIVGVHLHNTEEKDGKTYLQPIVVDDDTAKRLEADSGDNSVKIVKEYLATG